jgi:hypothetical protein
MPTAFLLRFQEPCLPDDAPGVLCGTRTETKILREQSDNDQRATACHVLPRSTMQAGTATKRGIPKEAPDTDEA